MEEGALIVSPSEELRDLVEASVLEEELLLCFDVELATVQAASPHGASGSEQSSSYIYESSSPWF